MSSAPVQFLNFNIPSTTEGHLRTKYNVKLLFFKSTYLPMHNDTPFGTCLFSVGTYRGNLPVSSRFSKRDLNFCVHSIPLWEPCVERRATLRAHIHLLWASSRQHECGIKHNKLRVSLAFDHAWMSDYICMYICLLVYNMDMRV